MTTNTARIEHARRALSEAHRATGLPQTLPSEGPRVVISTGISQLDEALGGGFARGSLYAIAGEASSGRMSLSLSWLQQVAEQSKEPVAFIDGADALDPSGLASVLRARMLWVRARTAVEAIECAEQAMDTGGFAMVCLYLVEAIEHREHPVQPAHWGRVLRRAESSQSIALAVTSIDDPRAPGSFARARMVCHRDEVTWGRTCILEGNRVALSVTRNRQANSRQFAQCMRVSLQL